MSIKKIIARCLDDHTYYCEKYLWIQTAEPRIVPFKLNSVQKKLDFYVHCLKMKPEDRPEGWDIGLRRYNPPQTLERQHTYLRVNVLKARREGLSTYIESRGFGKAHLVPATKGLVVAHHKESTGTIFRMSKLFYDKLPNTAELRFKPATKYNTKNELFFEKTHSSLHVQTASEVDVSRSGGFSFVHCSELAFWENADATMLALAQTMQEYDGTEWWNESTPNGQGGKGAYFYDWWNATKKGDTDFVNIFFSWYDFDEYTKPFIGNEESYFWESVESGKQREMFGDEKLIMRNFNLSPEQMNWRRWYIKNKCQGDLNKFNQEYPQDDESCFLASGGNFFNVNLLLGYQLLCKDGERGDLYYTDDTGTEVYFNPNPKGFVTVWRKPDYDALQHRYAMGWDISMGVEEGDYTCGMLLDRRDSRRTHILTWHGLLPPDLVAEELLKISLWYHNDIWHCIERQGEGNAVINFIKEKYYKLYTKRVFGKVKNMEQDIIGFDMSAHGRAIVLPQLNSIINQDILDSPDYNFWEECKSFMRGEVYNKGGLTADTIRARALNKGKHNKKRRYDDRVFAMACAIEMDITLPAISEDFSKLPKWLQELHNANRRPKTYMGV